MQTASWPMEGNTKNIPNSKNKKIYITCTKVKAWKPIFMCFYFK